MTRAIRRSPVLRSWMWTVLALTWVTAARLDAQGPVIQACAANRDGALRLAVGGCDLRREMPIEWAQHGPTVSITVPIGPVLVDRPGTGCDGTAIVDERTVTVTLGPGDYRVHPLVSEVLQVNDATGQSLTSLDFDHAVTGTRVAISYWRIFDKGQSQLLALNSSSFRLTETTPVLVTMRAEQRGCGHAEMAGALYFDRVTLTPAVIAPSAAAGAR